MYPLLQALVDCGWLRSDTTGSLYGIGIRDLHTGASYLDSDPHVRVARPYLYEASEALGETIHLARLDDANVVYLATRESHAYPRWPLRVARSERLPGPGRASARSVGTCGVLGTQVRARPPRMRSGHRRAAPG